MALADAVVQLLHSSLIWMQCSTPNIDLEGISIFLSRLLWLGNTCMHLQLALLKLVGVLLSHRETGAAAVEIVFKPRQSRQRERSHGTVAIQIVVLDSLL